MVTVWEYSPGDVFLSMLWFFLFFIWIWLLITVFADIFRSDDMGGWGKALWTIFVIVLPYLGVFVYLIARGHEDGRARGLATPRVRSSRCGPTSRASPARPAPPARSSTSPSCGTPAPSATRSSQQAKAKLLA